MLQLGVATQFQACLGLALQVQETHHVGKEFALGITPLWVDLHVNPTDAQGFHQFPRLRAEVFQQADATALSGEALLQIGCRQVQDGGQPLTHLRCGAPLAVPVAGELKIDRVGPDAHQHLVPGQHLPLAINNGPSYGNGPDGGGLTGAGLLSKGVPLNHLEPEQPSRKTQDGQQQQEEHHHKPPPGGGRRSGALRTAA